MKIFPRHAFSVGLAGLALVFTLSVHASAPTPNPPRIKIERAASEQDDDFDGLRSRAEAFHVQGAYARAHELYVEAEQLDLSDDERRWVRFRLADTKWRAVASTNERDGTELERAREALTELLKEGDPERVDTRDRTWAEINESLGAYHWLRSNARDWNSGWNYFAEALGWWGRSSDLELARRRYLDIVFEVALPAWNSSSANRGGYASNVPRQVLENAVEIAVEKSDVATARFLLGTHYARNGRNVAFRGRVERELGAVLALGKSDANSFYGEALFQLAMHLQNTGRPERSADGTWVWSSDYAGAVELYRRVVREFRKGETHWYDQARRAIEEITSPTVGVRVGQFFLPGSDIGYDVDWRNVESVDLALFRTNLVEDVDIARGHSIGAWLDSIDVQRLEVHRRWTHTPEKESEARKHHPHSATLTLDEAVPPGAYVLQATSAGKRARALVLVSDVALTTKATGDGVLVWMTDVLSGAPVPDASVKLWRRYHDGNEWRARDYAGKTSADGTLLIPFEDGGTYNSSYLVAAKAGARTTWAQSDAWPSLSATQEWRIYAYTDRAAYRPGDEVNWKLVARRYDGRAFATPKDETLEWRLHDPQGAEVAKGVFKLDEFGCATATFETDEKLTLGEYQVQFTGNVDNRSQYVGGATLFRLEEYKAPEFEVNVRVPDRTDDGAPRAYVVGDTIEVEIDAKYYFGAPVAEANVEVFVYQANYHHEWKKDREFPWLYETQGRMWWGGQGNQIVRQVLTTDRDGHATLSFETPADARADLEYTIEARVTDASRREILGSGKVRVTRSEYFARIEAQHAIHRPGAKIELDIETIDANGNGIAADGRVEVSRQRWVEVWMSPTGVRKRRAEFEDRRVPDGWQVVSRQYDRDVVATVALRTSAAGQASWSFTPDKDGSYHVLWTSVDGRGSDVRGESTVVVADENSRELGFYSGGVEILIDKDTLAIGDDAIFVLSTPASGRWVLLTVESQTLQHHEVVHLDGSVKLMRIPMTEEHVPNIWLGAVSVSGGEAFHDSERLIIPPARQFLDIDVAHDAEVVEPGSAGTVHVTVRDHNGDPVRVQLSIGVVDDSLAYIQSDYAGDPRRFFYGQLRDLRVRTAGSFQHGVYRLYKDAGGYRGAGDTVPPGGRYDRDELKEEEMSDGFALGLGAKRANMAALGYAGDSAPAESMARQKMAADALAPAGAGGGGPAVRVRSDFRDTAFWAPTVRTDKDGHATMSFEYPDSTTRWKTTVRAVDRATRVGMGEALTKTRQPIIARLQAPRFFVVGDVVTLSGNVNNNTDIERSVRVSLAATGLELLGHVVEGELMSGDEVVVSVPAGGQARVDWRARIDAPGSVELVLTAKGEEYGDALRRELPAYAHGIEALVATSGRFDDGGIRFAVDLPEARAAGTTSLRIQVTPSLAVTMLDALPYLANYPYGCTEQTLSRFLPSVIVAKTLSDFGLSAGDAMTRVFGGIERDFTGKTHPDGKRSLEQLDRMTGDGLDRLYDFQHADGGWSWWKTGDSDHFMTAYVLWGLSLARDAGVDVRAGVLERAAAWLGRELVEEEWNVDLQAWMLHALALHAQGGGKGASDTREWSDKAFANLWKQRDRLNAYGRALVALSANALGREAEALAMLDILMNGAILDESPDTSIVQVGAQTSREYVLKTAHFGGDGIGYRWSDGGVEATAFSLRALVAIDPKHELVEPLANWLVQNRRGAQWSNTRDTAITVLALNDYLRATKQLGASVAYTLTVNGQSVASVELTPDEMLRAPSEFDIDPEWLRAGENEVRIEKTSGDGPLYFAAHARFFSEEEPIPARGNVLFARREYFKLVGRPTLLGGFVYDRVALRDGDSVTSGERIEVVLTVEAKNNLEYLMFEDLKPAGFEAVQLRSGEALVARELKQGEVERQLGGERDATVRNSNDARLFADAYTGLSRGVHQELRDRKIALFADRLADGFWEMRYELRAEAPGEFHALPLLGEAMYVPEVQCNSEEIRVTVLDREVD